MEGIDFKMAAFYSFPLFHTGTNEDNEESNPVAAR